MSKRSLSILLFFMCSLILFAQEVSFVASGPKYVRVGEQFQIQYSLNKTIDEFTPPVFTGFDLLGGPMQGSSSSTSIINGKVTRNYSYSLTYILMGNEPGKYTIQPAQAEYKGDIIKSNLLEIEVVAGSGQSTSQQSGSTQKDDSPTTSEASDDQMFVSLILNKKTVYVGEQITAWVKIYTKVSLSGIDRSYKGPEFQGFYKEKLELPPLSNLEQEKVGNEIYYSGPLEKIILYPQKSGKLRIEPFELIVYLQKKVNHTGSIFDDFFGPSYKSVPVKLKSKPVIVDVKPLPDNQPEGYSGAVGNYSIRSMISSESVKTNDAVNFKVTISGKGNIKLIEKINYELPASLEVYDPVIKTNLDNSGTGGTKTFEITAIPRHAGIFDIKPFRLVFFDPSSGTYKTIETQSHRLEVDKGDTNSSMLALSGPSKEEVEFIGSDIRYLITDTKLKRVDKLLVNSIGYYIIYVLAILILIGVYLVKRKKTDNKINVHKTNNRLAIKRLNKRFKKVKSLLKQNKKEVFYEEMSKAIWGYLSDKLNIAQSSLSTSNAREMLTEKGVESSEIENLISIISTCEFARYASGTSGKDIEQLYKEAVGTIYNIDQKL